MNGTRTTRRQMVKPAITGKEIVSLMRKHRVTIRELSRRMQITQKRIRQVRETGLDHPGFARDWFEHIKEDELVVITKTYDLILWSCNHTSRFPRNHRFVLGERIERNLYDLLETLIQAKYTNHLDYSR